MSKKESTITNNMPIKYNFIPEHQLKEKRETFSYTVSIFAGGALSFPNEVVRIYELDGKYVTFYVDKEKKLLGWSIVEGNVELESLKKVRQLRKTVNGNVVISVRKLLKELGVDSKSYLSLTVNTYTSTLHASPIYYVEFPGNDVENDVKINKVPDPLEQELVKS